MPKVTPTTKLSIFNSITKMLIVSLSFFLGVHLDNIGFSGGQIGLLFAIATLASILTILPSGISNDTFKSKHLIGIALICIGIQYLGLSITHKFPVIAILFLIGGIGYTLYTSSSDSLFYKSTNKEHVPRKIGIFHSLNYLMMGLGMITAGYLLKIEVSFEKLFAIFSAAFLLMSLISQITLPKTQTSKLELLHYKKDILQPKVLLFLLIMFLFAIHFGAENTTYGLFLKKTLKLNALQMGLYMGIAIMTMALTVLVISKNLHKWKTSHVLLFGLFLSGSGHILMTINRPIISALFRIYHEIGDAAMFFFVYYGITKLFDLRRIGGNAGIFTFTATIGGAIGAMIFGPLGAAYGYNIPLIASGGTTLIAFLLAIPFIHHFDHQ